MLSTSATHNAGPNNKHISSSVTKITSGGAPVIAAAWDWPSPKGERGGTLSPDTRDDGIIDVHNVM